MTSPPQRFWMPGPVAVHPEVMAAMQQPMIGHRSPAALALRARIDLGMRKLFQTRRPVVIATCSATGLMEAAIRSGVRDSVLCVVSGVFGERFARIAERCDKEVIRLHVPRGEALEPDLLATMLDGPPVDAVTLVHAETSTGAQQPVAELLRLLRPLHDVVTIVDAVSTVAAAPVDPAGWGADVVLTGSQKALGLPPGLAFATVSDRFLERAAEQQDRGLYLDLVALHEDAVAGRWSQTPALPQLFALDVQLERIALEGLDARWARHRSMREMVENWVASHGRCALFATAGRRADAVTALRLAPGRSAAGVVHTLDAEGWQIATTRDDPEDRIIRIGHMGDARPEDLAELLMTIEPRL